MRPASRGVIPLTALVATLACASAEVAGVPTGNWQSPSSENYTWALHPALTGGEMYLKIDVATDGSFRGEWGEYFCTGPAGVYAATCRVSGKGERVSGRFGADGQGVIDLERRGRGTFAWTTPATDELAIDLPKNWLGGADARLYRARLTRDGKRKPATTTPSPEENSGPLLSGVALYREFKQDERVALARHAGKRLVLEGRRGTLIDLGNGGAAIHVPDGFTSRALVLTFPDLKQVSSIAEGARFRFSCTVESFDYQYVHLRDCAIVR